jgi:DNA-binding beta-propeller fold protein YncE
MLRIFIRIALFCAFVFVVPVHAETLLIGNKGENTVSFVDLPTGTERARLETGSAPHEIAVSPDGKQAAVVAYGGSTIDVIDIAGARLLRRIDIAPNLAPHGLVWLRSGRLVVAAEKSRSMVVVDPHRGTFRALPTGQAGTHMVAVSSDQRRAYVANVQAGTIGVFDLLLLRKIRDIVVGGMPEGIALTRDGRQLWVGDNTGPRLRVVDLSTGQVISTLPTDPVPIRVAISPDGQTALTSNIGSGTLSVFDVATRRPVRTIRVSGEREAMQVTAVFSRDGSRVFVAETGRNVIAEVDFASGKVLRRLPAGKGGDGIGIAP